MYSSVLSLLLLGIIPGYALRSTDHEALGRMVIAAPSPLASDADKAFSLEERVSASGVLIADLETGQVLFEKYADVRRPMASLTKLMTALLIVENHSMDEWVTIPSSSFSIDDNVAYLPTGHHFRVGALLSALLIPSANDAASALALFHSGSSDAFVAAMNERAVSLGLKNTSFQNPVGLDDPDQWSTPQDLAWLASFALRNPDIRSRLSRRGVEIHSREGFAVTLTHTHALLHAESGVVAGKTGTTKAAGQCLFSLVEKGNRQYLVVLLHSLQRYKDMRIIIDALGASEII